MQLRDERPVETAHRVLESFEPKDAGCELTPNVGSSLCT
jgi:hypothetical protein